VKLLLFVHCWGIEQAERVGSSATRTAGTSGKVSTSVCRMRSSLTGPSGACTTRAGGGGHHQIHIIRVYRPPSTTDTASSSSAVLLTDCYMCMRPNDVSCCWVQYISPPTRSFVGRFCDRYAAHICTGFSLLLSRPAAGPRTRVLVHRSSALDRESPSQLSGVPAKTHHTCTKAKCKRSARDGMLGCRFWVFH
jgi:hypothetical protein